jgi:hypothetical protein
MMAEEWRISYRRARRSRTRVEVRPQFLELRDKPIAGLAPMLLLPAEKGIEFLLGACHRSALPHQYSGDGGGVTVAERKVALKPLDDIAMFGEPLLRGQLRKIIGRFSGLGFDIV